MYFGRINTTYLTNNVPQDYVKQRFEYVLHYWTYLFSYDRYESTISKFESHRTLFDKIEMQLNYNSDFAKKYFHSIYVTNNPLFDDTNIVVRNHKKSRKFQNTLRSFKSEIATNDKKSNNLSKIKQDFNFLKRTLLKNYTTFLSNQLFKIVIVNKPLTRNESIDLKFLVNAFIAELFHYGYESDFISYVITAITFTSHPMDQSFNIPFDKTRFDFPSDIEFKKYVEDNRKNFTLKGQIECLVNLLNRKKTKGHLIFKIPDYLFNNEEKLLIAGSEIYNPQKAKKVLTDLSSPSIELFAKDLYNSSCNIIIPVELVDASIGANKAISLAEKNINFLKCFSGFSGIKIDKSQFILTNENIDRYFLINTFYNNTGGTTFISNNNVSKLHTKLNRFDASNDFYKQLFSIISQLGKTSNAIDDTSISELWISTESFFSHIVGSENRRKELITITKSCYKLQLKNDYLDYLNHRLGFIFTKRLVPSYYLEGIELTSKMPEKRKTFKSNINRLTKRVSSKFSIPLYYEFVHKINDIKSLYETEITRWIEYTINHVYCERNLEIHNNIKNEITYSFLLQDFRKIISVVLNTILNNVESRTNNAEGVFKKINKKASRIVL